MVVFGKSDAPAHYAAPPRDPPTVVRRRISLRLVASEIRDGFWNLLASNRHRLLRLRQAAGRMRVTLPTQNCIKFT